MRRVALGFGGAPIGGLFAAVSDDDAQRALERAWSLGIRAFDTAPLYGFGLSEQRIGAFLHNQPRHEYTLSTKVGRILEPATDRVDASGSLAGFEGGLPNVARFDFRGAAIRQSLEASLARLQVAYVDTAFIHDPDEHIDAALDQSFPELVRLRSEGSIRAIGLGTNAVATAERLLETCDVDVLMIAGRYTLLDRSATQLLERCRTRGIRVVAAGVFNSGILAHDAPATGARYNYATADAAVLKRAQDLAATCARFGVHLRDAALAFPMRNGAVESIVVGMRDADEVAVNVAASNAAIPEALWEALG